MLLLLRQAKEYVRNMDHNIQGILRLGVSSLFARYQLPGMLKDFLNQYPGIEIHLKTGWSLEVIQSVNNGEVHIGIIRGDYNWPEQRHLLSVEPICLASKKPISLSELPSLPRINYQTDSSLKYTIEKWWKDQYTVPPLITMEVDKIETCKEMVNNGLGYAIFPSMCLKNYEDLFTINLTDKQGQIITRETWLFYRNSSLEMSVIKAFVEFLQTQTEIMP